VPKEFELEELIINKNLEKLVIREKGIGIEYFTKINMPEGILEYKTVYLGSVDNISKGKLDFVYSAIYSGLSRRANPRIAVYNNNERLGQYYVGWDFSIIPIILKDELIISYNDDEYCNQTTRISFKDSIPQMIFIHCNEENGEMFGDLYNFEKEKENKK